MNKLPSNPGPRQLGGGGRAPLQLRVLLGLVLSSAVVLVMFNMTLRLPRNTLLLEDELAGLLLAHPEETCPREGPGGAPIYCRLGLPPDDAGNDSGGSSSSETATAGSVVFNRTMAENATAAANATAEANATAATAVASASSSGNSSSNGLPQHRLAVLIPYRDREKHLMELLASLRPHLDRQERAHDVFVVEQGDAYLFNRGLLLNAAAQVLHGSAYDYFVFQDVDTIPLAKGGIQYSYPKGRAPLYLTPHWLHPKSTYEDFFGGLLIMTVQQFWHVNGFGTQFWGWGREDDNLRERLVQASMWPPEYPIAAKDAGRFSKHHYFKHQAHEQATELRAAADSGGALRYFQENPRIPYRGAKIMSSQPQFLRDFQTGLNTTMFRILSMQPFLNATRIRLQLYCNASATPWCEPKAIVRRQAPAIKHAVAVHAVVGS